MSEATHIVGGEFELVHIENFDYKLNMILYFDDVYGNPQAEDPFVDAYIFSKKTNEIITFFRLSNNGSSLVPYTNMECAIGELVTRRILYQGFIKLSPEIFNEPEGYYITWDRCCRNNVINNIINPEGTGQLFYLEFPPIVINDEPFINSSPILFPPLSDYACVNDFYYVDFGGTDPDGDSLVYSMAHPLAGFSNVNDPLPSPPFPAPYPLIRWESGISTSKSIPGEPALGISREGLLTVKPESTGLYVFSVRCEEYRDGVKIGEVRRDFQMLVIDCPPPGNKPEILVKTPEATTYVTNPDTIYFATNENKCVQFIARDKDAIENLSFQVKPVNFKADLNANLSIRTGELTQDNDSIVVEFCFPDCPFVIGEAQVVDVIVGDDSCPLPLLDTVRLAVVIEPPPNQKAYFDTTLTEINYQIREGELIDLRLKGLDPDGDSLTFRVVGLNIDTADFDLDFKVVNDAAGSLEIDFHWDSNCQKYDFNDTQDLSVLLLVDDDDYCNLYTPDSLLINIRVELPPNTPPQITTDLDADSIQIKVLEDIIFNISALDTDNDQIIFTAYGNDFDLDSFAFLSIDSSSVGLISIPYGWSPDCTFNPDIKDEFIVFFTVEDNDKCKIRNADTLAIKFQLELPDNSPPEILIPSENYELIAGDSVFIPVNGIDPDNDSLSLYLFDPFEVFNSTGASFDNSSGFSEVTSNFSWLTDCSHLLPDLSDGVYPYKLILRDNKCLVPKSDTVDLVITVKNRELNDENLFIPNVFSPNGDGINDLFLVENLPSDNCRSWFLNVSIVNRYGKKVYFSEDRNFRWSGENVGTGVYYYHINYSKHDYKGWLHVLR